MVAPAQFQTDHLAQVGRVIPDIVDVDDQPPLHETAVDRRIELFRLIGGGDDDAVAAAVGDLIKDDVRGIDQGGLLPLDGTAFVGAAES